MPLSVSLPVGCHPRDLSDEFILQPTTTGHCSLEMPLQSLLVRIVRSRSQNHGLVKAGRNLWRPRGPSATSEQGHLETVAQDCDQGAFDASRGGGSSASLVTCSGSQSCSQHKAEWGPSAAGEESQPHSPSRGAHQNSAVGSFCCLLYLLAARRGLWLSPAIGSHLTTALSVAIE